MLLVAGGSQDTNLHLIVEQARRRGVPVEPLLIEESKPQLVSWDLIGDRLTVDRKPITPVGVFLRYDAFQPTGDPIAASNRAAGWHAAIAGWAMSHDVGFANRNMAFWAQNKPFVLVAAARLGVPIPSTVVTTDLERVEAVASGHSLVVKPTAGGDYCHEIEDGLSKAGRRAGVAAIPGIVQQRLAPPEVRVYVVGQRFFCFQLRSDQLDYRLDTQCGVSSVEPDVIPEVLRLQLLALVQQLGMDFAAIDLKADAQSGELVFLEVNSQPMFAAFDQEVDGAITDALLTLLGVA